MQGSRKQDVKHNVCITQEKLPIIIYVIIYRT